MYKGRKMKGVACSILCFVALALMSLPVMLPAPIEAATNTVHGAVTLMALGDSSAEWTGEDVKFGSCSAKLTMPNMSWESSWGERRHNAEAMVDITDTLLADITGFSFWQKVDVIKLWVTITFYLDSGGPIRSVFLLPAGKAPGTDWFEVTQASFIFDGGKTWEQVKADFPGATVQYVKMGYGVYTYDEAVTAFLDNLTINENGDSTVYEFEGQCIGIGGGQVYPANVNHNTAYWMWSNSLIIVLAMSGCALATFYISKRCFSRFMSRE